MFEYFKISGEVRELAAKAEKLCAPYFKKTEEIQQYNQQKMLAAFSNSGVSETHFVPSTGYGYGDRGRDVLDEVFSFALGTEDALVRHNFVSGTHALTVALFGVLRPDDTMLCVTGTPYDTIHGVIGIKPSCGSLKEFGINYEQIDLLADGSLDFESMGNEISPKYKMIYIQRSRGYTLRPSLTVEEIAKITEIAKKKAPNAIVMVDNCYGEFVQKYEPTHFGADLMAGSLIKNIGGGIAPTGGYIAGKKELVEMCAYRLTTPGTGKEVGCTLDTKRELFMGTFNAPHMTGEAVKTAIFTSAIFSLMGYDVTPKFDEPRADIIQAVLLKQREALIAFCKGIQKGAPVDSFVTPEPSPMPGYDSEVIMAAGAFTMGSSAELSADAPLREPFAVWMQGGLNYHSGQLGIMLAAEEVLRQNNS